MDGTRFDSWTKHLSTSRSRRSLLRGITGGIVAAVGLSHTADARCSRPTPTSCGDSCVDLRTDPDNCGRCGNACPSGLCYAGRCLETCPSGFEPCGGTCIRGCGPGRACIDDACQLLPPAGICTPGDDFCADVGTVDCDESLPCYCTNTASGHPLCAAEEDSFCAECTRDADCPDAFFCITCDGCEDESGVLRSTACVLPCPVLVAV